MYMKHKKILTNVLFELSCLAIIFSFSLDGQFSKMTKNSLVSCSRSSAVTVGSTYLNHSFFSLESGISQLDHLHVNSMQKHATTVGLYWMHIVVKCKLKSLISKTVSFLLSETYLLLAMK